VHPRQDRSGGLMRIYVAAPWQNRDYARQTADAIASNGHTMTSSWYSDHEDTTDPIKLAHDAQEDFMGVISADVLVVLNMDTLSEGKAVEQGIAIGFQIPILVLGDKPQNVFQYLPVVTIHVTFGDLLEDLARRELRS